MNILIRFCENRSFIRIIRFALLAFMGVMLSNCERALEPEFPDFLLSNEAVFEDASTIEAAMAAIYAGLRDNSPVMGGTNGMSVRLGLYSDELQYYSDSSVNDNAFFNHSVLPNNNAVFDFWNNSYVLIFNVNAMIEGLENSPLPDADKESFLGEALFLRAYLHFYLAQFFGDIPYIQTTDYTLNASVSRMPLTEIYEKMRHDLTEAKALLTDVDNSGERLRVTKGAASAFLARLYLYSEQWEKAFDESNSVINSGIYVWQSKLNDVFLKESTCTIWQLKPELDGYPTKEGQTFIFDFGPPPLYALTSEFMMDFEEGDMRKDAWTRKISNGTETWFHSYKYKQNMYGISSSEYSILFRLAEQYLIRAEASLHIGNVQEAKEDLNTIRHR